MTPFELWKSLVDSFATLHDGVHKTWVVERAHYPDFEENAAANALLASLSSEQRAVLADMLIDARRGGIHDALVVLHDRMALNDGVYSEHGVQMEFEPFGYTLYQDYVGRREGEEWSE
jgi:hypothetical protein